MYTRPALEIKHACGAVKNWSRIKGFGEEWRVVLAGIASSRALDVGNALL